MLNAHHSANDLTVSQDLINADKTERSQLPFPGFVEKAFFCVRQKAPPRYQCLKLITWRWFEHISMLFVLLNCVTLGMHQPCSQHSATDSSKTCDTVLCTSLQIADHIIFAFFTIEMFIKMIAMGVFGKRTYLADSWNRLDCFIVVTG